MKAGKATKSPAKAGQSLNSRSKQPPVEQPPAPVPDGKPSKPGAEPVLQTEAEDARAGGIMARIPPAPEGVLAEKPDPRASYQVGPSDDNSPLIKVSASKGAPTPSASGIDTEDAEPAEGKPAPAEGKPATTKPTPGEDKKPEMGKEKK
jgi:hypothetical protein